MKKNLLLLFMMLLTGSLWSQVMISGVVRDESGEPIPGVTVMLKDAGAGKPLGTITDFNGKYSLSLSVAKGTLVYTFIGMENTERNFAGNAVINVVMTSQTIGLNEVVAIGYGSQRKASVIGAISTVSSKELTQSPSANLGNALAGRLPGLVTIQTSGQPGADDPKMFIRGRATWGDTNPLYIVDGVERESITNIDANEIETISILKDASATAVYGVKGANGVIIVTTRRGTVNKPQISFSMLHGIQTPTRIPNFLRSYETAYLKNEAILNDYAGSIVDGVYQPNLYNSDGTLRMNQEEITTFLRNEGGFSAQDLAAFKSGTANKYYYPDVDWWEEMVRKASPQQQYNINISGGSNSARYFVSAGYLTQEGIFKTESNRTNFGFQRFNLRSNLDLDITKDITFSINLGARVEGRNLPNGSTWNSSGDPFYSINRTAPYETAIINPDGRPGYGINKLNAWAGMNKTGYKHSQDDVLESAFIFKYNLNRFVKGLSVKAQMAYDSYYFTNKSYGEGVMWSNIMSLPGEDYYYEYSGVDEPFNYLGGYTTERQKTYVETSAFYERAFGNHNLTALVLYNQSDYRTGFSIPYRYSGLVSRVTYDFSKRYYGEFNLGYNGSENFARGKRFGFFPSYSLGWMLSEEDFIKNNLPALSVLKLRGSYGMVGNDKIGGNRFLYFQDFNAIQAWAPRAGAKFGLDAENRLFIYETAASNPDVTWEKAQKMNVGIEATIFHDLLSFTGDVFYEKRKDILMNRQTVMQYLGVDAPPANVGETENKGFELELTHRYSLSDKLSYWVKANTSFTKNKTLSYDEPANKVPWQKVEGQAIGQFQGYIAEGFFRDWDEIAASPEQAGTPPHPGDLKFKDINGDNVIDDKDQTYIGRTDMPALTYGFSLGAQYGGFDCSVLFQGATLTNMFIWDGMMFEFTNKNGKLLDHHNDRWAYYTDPFTGEVVDTRATAKYPRLNNGANPNQKSNTFLMLDNSYLKLRNVEVGYTFDKTALTQIGVSKFRIYATGSNLFTWSKIKNVDPEGYGKMGSAQNYPQLTVYSLGLNVTF